MAVYSDAHNSAGVGPEPRGPRPVGVGFSQYALDPTEIARRLRDRLPLAAGELADLLAELGLAAGPSPFRALQAAFRSAGVPLPFRLVGRNEKIAVPRATTGLARAVLENASRQVLAWGLTEVTEVMSRAAAIGQSVASEAIVERLLGALPRLRWLDDRKRWFSFVDERSVLGKSLERVFAVAGEIHIVELAMALAKSSPAVRRAPVSILARYLIDVAGCQVAGNQVRGPAGAGGASLPPGEQALVDLLQSRDGTADFAELDRLVGDRSRATALKRLARRSPLFLKTARGRLRLIGHGPVAAAPWT